jgi:biotin carboxyl carrier protein
MSIEHKPSRDSLLAVLIEAGKSFEEINFSLQLAGYPGLTPLELADIVGVTPSKPSKDELVKAAKEASEAKAANVDPVKKAAKAMQGPTALDGDPASVKAKLLAVVGNKDGKPVRAVDAMITGTCYQIVEVMKIFSPEAAKQYAAIKYPGGVESLATAETKRAAYLFAFAFMYDHFKL